MAREHFTGSIMRDIVRRINGADGITIDQQQQNAMYGVHQVRIHVAGDERPYRLVLALADVNLSINEPLSGGSLDGHFAEPIAPAMATISAEPDNREHCYVVHGLREEDLP